MANLQLSTVTRVEPSKNLLGGNLRFKYMHMYNATITHLLPCGGPKKSPRASSIVQVIFSFRSFEISEDILRNQKFIIG